MTTYPYEYSANVYATIPFKYKFIKDRYWDLQGSASANNDTSVNKDFLAYPGLSMSCEQIPTSLETVSVTGGQLPNYSSSSSILGCLATVGQGTKYTNFTKVGTPTVDEMTGVATGFSGSNYLTLGVNTPDSGTWEIVVKFKTGTSNSGASVIFGAVGTSMLPFYKDSNTLYAFLSSNGSSWDMASAASIMSISTNTTYKMKAEFTGSAYNWYNWENDTWVLKRTISSSSLVKGGNLLKIGSDFSNSGASVDLSETYMKVNDVMYWTPATTGDYYKVLKNGYVNYTTAGTPNINTDTGVVSGFTVNDYLACNDTTISFSNPWELKVKFTTGSSVSSTNNVVGCVTDQKGLRIIVTNAGKFSILNGNGSWFNTSSITGTYSVQTNTTYWIKHGWTGSTYYLKYSLDDETYVDDVSYNSSAACTFDTYPFIIGKNANANPFNGSVDLSGFELKINNSVVWTAFGEMTAYAVGLLPSGVVDDGTEKTWNLFYNYSTETFLLDTTATMSGYVWVGNITIPAHTV